MDRRAVSVGKLPWWSGLAAINLLLVFSTMAHHKLVLNGPIHAYLRQIDLAIEMNFAAWWSGVLLFGLGLLAYEIFSSKGERSKLAWLLLAIAFTCLSVDEVGSIHERVEDWLLVSPWPKLDPYVPVAGLGLLLIPYPLIELLRHHRTRKAGWLLLTGFLLFTSIALQERIEGYVNWGDWWPLRLGIEEGTELLGMSLCYGGLVSYTWRGSPAQGWSGVLPNPLRMKFVPAVVLAGLVVHLGVSAILIVSVSASADSPAFSEHVLVWYPIALSIVLGLSAFWRYRRAAPPGSAGWWVLAIYFWMHSAALPYVIPLPTERADALFSGYLYPFYVLQLLLSAVLFVVFRKRLRLAAPVNYIVLLAMSLTVIWAGVSPDSMVVRYALPGIFTGLWFQLFFWNAFSYGRQA